MPSPTLQPIELRPLVERVAALETRLPVEIAPGPDMVLTIDPDLIEQMLINLVRNAVDAALEQAQSPPAGSEPAPPRVILRWEQFDRKVALMVEDNGIGLLNPSNAFVPLLHHQARRLGHRAGAVDSRSPRRTAAPSSWPTGAARAAAW